MDRLESLGTQLSQITMYDIKSMYNQAKNVVLNVSEMEAKVREATNDEPWGASSSLMQDIASGTFNFQHFNEIMPCIYARFMEKEARQWRQIYKALQLIEYLIKHGSERVVDDARSHISTIKMLRNFHYIDDKGKDEGVNVRNRSRELVELLSDVEKIRGERRKAKANKHKYVGTGNDGFGSGYGGFGNDSGGYGGGSYDRDYSGSYSGGGRSSPGFRDDARRGGFEEYNAGDDEVSSPTRRSSSRQNSGGLTSPTRTSTTAAPAKKESAKEVDLLGGFDEEVDAFGGNGAGLATDKALPSLSGLSAAPEADDDFADFQAAPTPSAPVAAATTTTTANKPNLLEMLNSAPANATAVRPTMGHSSTSSFSQTPVQPPAGFANNTNSFGMMSRPAPAPTQNALFSQPTSPPPSRPTPPTTASTTAAGGSKPSGNFDDLWTMSLGSSAKPTTAGLGTKSIKDLEKEKATAGIWGAGQKKPAAGQFGDFGNFGGSGGVSGNAAGGGGGGDDLLL